MLSASIGNIALGASEVASVGIAELLSGARDVGAEGGELIESLGIPRASVHQTLGRLAPLARRFTPPALAVARSLESFSTAHGIASSLQHFERLAQAHRGPIPWSVTLDGRRHDRHIVVTSAMHGNEIGSISAVIDIIERMLAGRLGFGGKITFALGNVPAFRLNQRFIQGEGDLNRKFGDAVLGKNPAGMTPTEVRAVELAGVVRDASLVLDLHQMTYKPRGPFHFYEISGAGGDINHILAEVLGVVDHAIYVDVNRSPLNFDGEITTYAHSQGALNLGIELSREGFHPSARLLARRLITRVMEAMDQINRVDDLRDSSRFPRRHVTQILLTHLESWHDRGTRLNGTWPNRTLVEKGTVLGWKGDGTPIIMPYQGYIFFAVDLPRDQNGNIDESVPLPNYMFALGRVA